MSCCRYINEIVMAPALSPKTVTYSSALSMRKQKDILDRDHLPKPRYSA
jgi:hypothetical protein